MTLTLYVAHALVFNLVVDWLGWVGPTGLDTALTFAAIYWVIAIAFAAWYHRRFGIGPFEWVYRVRGIALQLGGVCSCWGHRSRSGAGHDPVARTSRGSRD